MRGGGAAVQRPRVCFFGTYAREYTVTRRLRQACDAAGSDVVECHQPLWEAARTKPPSYFGSRSTIRLLRQYIGAARNLARARRQLGPVGAYLVGFNGQLDVLLLRWLTRRLGATVLFAPLVTLTETLVEDRAVFSSRSPRAALAWLIDRMSLAAASRVIIDTAAHRQYLIDTFRIAPERIAVWHLGCDTTVFRPSAPRLPAGPLRVLFCGSFLPLHGVRTILDAATLLDSASDLQLEMIGEGPELSASLDYVRASGLGRVHFTEWVAYEKLGHAVAEADICLGVFGTTRKAQMVIPNKVYQAAAVGRPIITGDTPAVREIFTHGETVWLCPPGNPHALAEAIRTLSGDAALRARLGGQAAALMAERFSIAQQAARLAQIFAEAEA